MVSFVSVLSSELSRVNDGFRVIFLDVEGEEVEWLLDNEFLFIYTSWPEAVK